MEQVLQNIKSKAGFIIDMDGVIYQFPYRPQYILNGIIDLVS